MKKKEVRTADEKIITVSADCALFGRLLIAANSRDVQFKEVLSYELAQFLILWHTLMVLCEKQQKVSF